MFGKREPSSVANNCCASCLSPDAPWHLITIPNFGDVRACINPTNCRERAIALGIWAKYPHV